MVKILNHINLIPKISSNIDLRRGEKRIALSNLSIYY